MHGGSDDPSDLDLMEFQDARFTFLAYRDRRDDNQQSDISKNVDESVNGTVSKKDLNKEILGVVGKEDTSKVISSDKFPMHPPLYRKFGLKPGEWVNWRYSIYRKDIFFWTKYVEEKYSQPVQLHLKSKGFDVLRVNAMKSIQDDGEPSYEKDKAKYMVGESIHPAIRWVGAVNHNGSITLPPNQNGERQHYHHGLGNCPYKFSYWPHKKEVSWWNFPSDEEELAVKVEDYLIRRGYSVDRHVDYTGKKIRDVLTESMFPKDFDRHSLGSCMAAAAMATDYLLSKGRNDFKVVEGWVSLYPNQEEEDFSPHTWIQFNNGKIFDPTKKQWAVWGFDPKKVSFEKIKKTYTPDEYQSVCQRQPDDLSKFKKMAEATLMNDEIPEKLYHGTFRPLLDEILTDGIIPGGKDTQNFDWAGKFVYLAETAGNAISFVEVSENEDIPEEWFDDIIVLEIDVSKLDLTKMSPDENWNPSTGEGDEGYRSFQYGGIISPDSITVL